MVLWGAPFCFYGRGGGNGGSINAEDTRKLFLPLLGDEEGLIGDPGNPTPTGRVEEEEEDTQLSNSRLVSFPPGLPF